MNAWKANPHQFGTGKVHWISTDDSSRTLCGKYLNAVPGKLIADALDRWVSCLICRNKVVSDRERAKQRAEWMARDRQ